MTKSSYLLSSVINFISNDRKICPNCSNSAVNKIIESKYYFTKLLECSNCGIRFRIPTDSNDKNKLFYNFKYKQGFTTSLPSERELNLLLANKFKNHEKNFDKYIELLKILGINPERKILDYGCSWGYGSWQFKNAKYDVYGYDVSSERTEFAKNKLGINILNDLNNYSDYFDIFFSNHVIEHLPKPGQCIELAKKVLKKNGIFIAITPNGNEDYRQIDPFKYKKAWGQVHPFMVTQEFYKNLFNRNPFIIDSTPLNFNEYKNWDKKSQITINTSGAELIVISLLNV